MPAIAGVDSLHGKAITTGLSTVGRYGRYSRSRGSGARNPHRLPPDRARPESCAEADFRKPVALRRHLQRLRRSGRVARRADRLRLRQNPRPPARPGHHEGRLDSAHAPPPRPVPGRPARPSRAASPSPCPRTSSTCSPTPRTSGATAACSTSTTCATTSTRSPKTCRSPRALADYSHLPLAKHTDFFVLPDARPHARLHHAAGHDRRPAASRSRAT